MRISDWSSDVCSSDLPLAIRFIAEVLCELVPRDDLSPLTRDPRQTVGEIGVEIERGRDTLELANCHLVQRHGMIYQMAVERLRHANLASEGAILVERASILV